MASEQAGPAATACLWNTLTLTSLPPRCAPQLEGEKAAAADKQSRVLDELAEARQRLKGLERELKALGAQQKSLAAQKQVCRQAARATLPFSKPEGGAMPLQHAGVGTPHAGGPHTALLCPAPKPPIHPPTYPSCVYTGAGPGAGHGAAQEGLG